MDSGDEMQMTFTCGSWCYESSVNYKEPNGFWQNWNLPTQVYRFSQPTLQPLDCTSSTWMIPMETVLTVVS